MRKDEKPDRPPAESEPTPLSADRYRAYVEQSPLALFVVDERGRFLDANPAACELSGFTLEELLQLTFVDLTVGDPPMAAFEQLRREGRVTLAQRMRRKDGSELFIRLDGVALTPSHFMAFATDLTELRAKESALRRERDRVQQVLDTVEAIIVRLDHEGRITLINRKGCDILGRAQHELLGRSWFDTCLPVPERDEVRRFFQQAMAGAPTPAVAHYSNQVLTADGRVREIEWHNSLLRDDDGRLIGSLSAGRDVTDQKRLEARLLQTQRLEALGTLAGGVAHDMNNVLASILALASLVERQVPTGHPAQADLGSLTAAAHRGKSLVANLLGFARKELFERRAVDVDAMVESVRSTFAPLLPEGIELKTDLAGDLEPAFIDEEQVAQVLVNLCINAADAIDERGSITIVTSGETLDAGQVQELPAGRYVRIDVADTGAGMSDEVRARVFEPFFTTKDVGDGTGLGLSMAYGVLHRHHGTIQLESRPGEGTRVSLWVPSVEDHPSRPASSTAWGATGDEGQPTLLLVDDEDVLRRGMSQLLAHYGYRVLECGNAAAALETYREHGADIDLVLLDVSMPEMNGLECLIELQQLDPDVGVLICTGQGKDGATEEALRRGCAGVVGKPIVPDRLNDVIRRALARSRSV